ncbi:MAG TPA: response regulator transcription factor [Actinobacteria bacterium]|nr:response regulator transcription factor [Actinomycetota bacterium]
MPIRTVNTFIADPQPIFVDGLTNNLKQYPGFRVTGWAHSLTEAKRKFPRGKTDLLLMEISLPRPAHGIELIKYSLAACPGCKIAVLSATYDSNVIYQAHQAGVHVYLLKENGFPEIIRVLETLMAGGKPQVSPKVEDLLQRRLNEDRNSMDNKLGQRELEILRLVAQGASDMEIASELNLTTQTVRHTNHCILRKFGVNNRTKAVIVALRNNLI